MPSRKKLERKRKIINKRKSMESGYKPFGKSRYAQKLDMRRRGIIAPYSPFFSDEEFIKKLDGENNEN